MSIRTRLLLLVLVLWLPAVAGLGLMARYTYLREVGDAQAQVQHIGEGLRLAVEREVDKHAVMAETLAASFAVRDADLRRFHAEATLATSRNDSWAVLVDRSRQWANTLLPFDPSTTQPRIADAPFTITGPALFFAERGPVLQRPVLAVFTPEAGVAPPRYNVGVAFQLSALQLLLDARTYPEGSVAALIDARQHVLARSRDPQKWVGKLATGDLQQRARAGASGFAPSVTLDGVPSLTYLSAPDRFGNAVIIALPQATLSGAARRLTLQAFAASGLLLVAGLALALHAARRIGVPVRALHRAAVELGQDRVPLRLSTGLTEADEVSGALHDAGVRIREGTRTLELRVGEAVQQAREAQARLLTAQKHEAIGRLTGGIAHDFNNLLQTISTAHHVLERTVGAEGPQRRVLEGAMRATTKAADLIRQMQTFGRAQPLQPQAVNLADLMLRSQELTSKAVGQRVALSAAIEPGLPALFVDPTQFELALLNLVFNARDALSGSGRILITGRPARPDEGAALGEGPFVCVEVADDGPGMDAETLARACEPYFTTKPVGEGSGLGLAQVQSFARQSGGELRIDSAPGAGTRVRLLLPVCDLAAPAPAARPSAPAPQARLHVLMVEDDQLVSSVVRPALESLGHRVSLCGSADVALALLSQPCQDFDVLFTDVVMPGAMSGTDLVDWCREHCPKLPALVASGFTARHPGQRVQVLHKPYGLDELAAALQQAVRQHPLAEQSSAG